MGKEQAIYTITGRYQQGRNIVGYHLQCSDGTNHPYTREQVIMLAGRGQVTNCDAQIYFDKNKHWTEGTVILRGIGGTLERLPINKIDAPEPSEVTAQDIDWVHGIRETLSKIPGLVLDQYLANLDATMHKSTDSNTGISICKTVIIKARSGRELTLLLNPKTKTVRAELRRAGWILCKVKDEYISGDSILLCSDLTISNQKELDDLIGKALCITGYLCEEELLWLYKDCTVKDGQAMRYFGKYREAGAEYLEDIFNILKVEQARLTEVKFIAKPWTDTLCTIINSLPDEVKKQLAVEKFKYIKDKTLFTSVNLGTGNIGAWNFPLYGGSHDKIYELRLGTVAKIADRLDHRYFGAHELCISILRGSTKEKLKVRTELLFFRSADKEQFKPGILCGNHLDSEFTIDIAELEQKLIEIISYHLGLIGYFGNWSRIWVPSATNKYGLGRISIEDRQNLSKILKRVKGASVLGF